MVSATAATLVERVAPRVAIREGVTDHYRPEIDGLRAIAVAAVVLYHAGVSRLTWGFVGVDIFFVISGYLITSILFRDWQSRGRIDFAKFYARRARRILPALWLIVTVALAAAAILLPPIGSDVQGIARSAMASMGFVANIYFDYATGDYFATASEQMPLLHLWSLGVEEQFYLFWPLLLAALLPRAHLRPRLVLATLAVASLISCQALMVRSSDAAFYELPARFWEIAVGGIIALGPVGSFDKRFAPWFALAGVVAILASIGNVASLARFPGTGALPAVVGTSLVLMAVHGGANLGVAGWLLSSPPMVFLGRISYSLYLWHWPLLAYNRLLSVNGDVYPRTLLLCLLAACLSWLTLVLVEVPARRFASKLRVSVVLLAGLSGSALVVLAAIGLGAAAKSALVATDPAYIAMHDRTPRLPECFLAFGDSVDAIALAPCSSRLGVSPRTLIWGDSHANAWSSFATELFDTPTASVASLALQGCPPAMDYSSPKAGTASHVKQCKDFNRLVAGIAEGEKLDVVVLAARWPMYMRSQSGSPAANAVNQSKVSLEAGLRQTLRAISPSVGRILILGPIPQLKRNAAWCIANDKTRECSPTRAEFDAQATKSRAMLKALVGEFSNVTYIETTNFYCDADACPMLRDGRALYFDDDHPTQTAAREFANWYRRGNSADAER